MGKRVRVERVVHDEPYYTNKLARSVYTCLIVVVLVVFVPPIVTLALFLLVAFVTGAK